jgi:acyl-CoA reductase-like NAD-dependent aldehyde dehydrogenase
MFQEEGFMVKAISDNYHFMVNGKERKTSKKIEVLDKYSNYPLSLVSQSGKSDVEDAIALACEGKKTFAETTAHYRSQVLKKAAGLIEERKEYFTTLIIREAGKPYKYALGEVNRCIENITYCGEEAKRIHGETLPVDASSAGANRTGYYQRYPAGVVLAISPFNFPLNLAAHKIAPAIAAGCPVIFKPSSLTPLTGIELTRVLLEAGVPGEALHVLVGPGQTIGELLVKDPRIAKISFTGSPEIGEQITRTAGLKKLTMELGSNSGVVIDKEIRGLDKIVSRCLLGAFYYQGQVCISIQRIFVHADIFESFIYKFLNAAENLKAGDPEKEDTDLGPMISLSEAERVENWVKEAVDQGAKILTGGVRNDCFYSPTVLTDVNGGMKVVKDEIFGPVVTVTPVDSFEDGVRLCDDSQYGLQAGFFTRNLDHALYAVDNIDAGGVIINDIPTYRVDHMPYGGNKRSGMGREGARFAIEEMTNIRMVVFNRN